MKKKKFGNFSVFYKILHPVNRYAYEIAIPIRLTRL